MYEDIDIDSPHAIGSTRTCEVCGGSGYTNLIGNKITLNTYEEKHTMKCESCNGTGKQTLKTVEVVEVECDECRGSNKIWVDTLGVNKFVECYKCKGNKLFKIKEGWE